MTTLKDLFTHPEPTRAAVSIPDGGPSLSYGEMADRVAGLADVFRRGGIGSGDAVSIALPNGLEFLETFLAATWSRAIAAPLNPAYTADEFKFFMEDTQSRALVLPPGDHPARKAAKELNIPVWEVRLEGSEVRLEVPNGVSGQAPSDGPEADDIALFLHTSGTTSRPKGVPLTHENLVTSLANIVNTYQLTPEDVSLLVMPLFHVHGLLGATLSTLSSGGTVIIPPRFSAGSFWGQVEAGGATWYSAVPTIHQILLTRAEDDGAPAGVLRFIRSCSSALAPVILERLESRFEAPVLEAYGMTEASHQMSSNPLPPAERLAGTVGAGTGVEITILDDQNQSLPQGTQGEVSIRGKNVTKGYHNNPTANSEAFTNSWFRTGDQGFLDENNYLTLTGRLKELINRGGEKISPLEVDAAMLAHPAVSEVVSFAAPDEKYGEIVHAAVILKSEATQEDIINFCRDRLADFKIPERIHFADDVPRTATGKIQRRHVAAHFLE